MKLHCIRKLTFFSLLGLLLIAGPFACGGDGDGGINGGQSVSCDPVDTGLLDTSDSGLSWVCNFDTNNPQFISQFVFGSGDSALRQALTLTEGSNWVGSYVLSGDNSITFNYDSYTIGDLNTLEIEEQGAGSFEMLGVCVSATELSFTLEGESYDCVLSDTLGETL